MKSHRLYRGRYKLLVGPYTGDILDGIALGACIDLVQRERWDRGEYSSNETSDAWRDESEGVWIERLNRRFKLSELEDQQVPYDTLGREIFVGDVIVYAMRNLVVSQLKITKIGDRNSGVYNQRKLYGVDLHTNKKTVNGHPNRCLKVSP
jgi:hypothetical protein